MNLDYSNLHSVILQYACRALSFDSGQLWKVCYCSHGVWYISTWDCRNWISSLRHHHGFDVSVSSLQNSISCSIRYQAALDPVGWPKMFHFHLSKQFNLSQELLRFSNLISWTFQVCNHVLRKHLSAHGTTSFWLSVKYLYLIILNIKRDSFLSFTFDL